MEASQDRTVTPGDLDSPRLETEFFACRAANTNSPAVFSNEIMLRLSDLTG